MSPATTLRGEINVRLGTGLSWNSKAPMSTVPADNPDEAGAALVGQERVAIGSDGQAVVAGVDGGAAGQEGDGLRRAAVVGQCAQARVGDADLVAVGAIGQAAGSAGADQVVRGRETGRPQCRRMSSAQAPLVVVLSATIVLQRVAAPLEDIKPAPKPKIEPAYWRQWWY